MLGAELTIDRQVIGVINVEGHRGQQFNDSHLGFVEVVAGLISTAITHAALFDEDTFRTPPTGCSWRPRRAIPTP